MKVLVRVPVTVSVLDALWRIGLRGAYLGLRAWWAIRHPESHGAFVAVWQGETLLLVRNSYRRGESTPSGRIHRGESPAAAAVRELREEVGILARERDLEPAGVYTVAFEGKTDHAHFFELRVAADVCVRIDRREVVHAAFVERAALAARPLLPHTRSYLDAAPARRDPD